MDQIIRIGMDTSKHVFQEIAPDFGDGLMDQAAG